MSKCLISNIYRFKIATFQRFKLHMLNFPKFENVNVLMTQSSNQAIKQSIPQSSNQ